MPWNSLSPLGTSSVKANKTIGQQNTTYIETTMGNDVIGTNTVTTRDHFWDVGSNEDGRHRFIQCPAFTVGGNPDNPVRGTGMDSVIYAKTTNSTVQWFHKNEDVDTNLWQITPTQIKGTVAALTSSYQTVTAVPINVYGEIWMYATNGTAAQSRYRTVVGYFRSDDTFVNTWALPVSVQGGSTAAVGVKFGNGSDADLLNIRARSEDASSGLTWNFIVTYRTL